MKAAAVGVLRSAKAVAWCGVCTLLLFAEQLCRAQVLRILSLTHPLRRSDYFSYQLLRKSDYDVLLLLKIFN